MKEYTVTVLDTTGIQPYIFGSNKLRENIGGSYLVKQATDDWVRKTLGLKDVIGVPILTFLSKQKPIEEGAPSEIVYAGGGNTILLFKSMETAIEFTKKLSRKVLIDAPGINLIVAHKKFDWDKDQLYEVVSNLMRNELEQQKYKRIPSSPLLGLGVTAFCNSTQLVAVDYSNNRDYQMPKDSKPYLISREIAAKLKAVSYANKSLKEMIEELLKDSTNNVSEKFQEYQLPLRIDQLGRSRDENSYVAVVHADGNSMGKRFREYAQQQSEQYSDNPNLANRAYVEAMRNLSKSVDSAGKQALKKVIETLVNSIQKVTENGKTVKKVVGKLGEFRIEENFFPFRPLVYGGDDITFVCDGRLGLELGAIYLQELEKHTMPDGKPIKACAGISIVKTHYPFARAYALSEALCKEAKQFVKKTKKTKEPGGFSALDWHIASSGLSGSISEIRQREYLVSSGNLTMRPIRLQCSKNEWQNWQSFTQVIEDFIDGNDWKGRKNKVLALREVLREGIDATRQFLKNYKPTKLPNFIPESSESRRLANDGWLNGVCGYFDAIEVIDFYLSLGQENNGTVPPENQVTE
ncbi:MAG: hypothetical protein F6K40_11665 [Okeania sp. SIO3I5]|uniref:Cas10/Cmr2 second palm domain-containing protein n=1 Tax=Okeania sp. SIO3I5 TaxID=2607805 RepID=UPI0013B5FC4C|nr:hypothetical protein [Okeania sp. SIO3I5]NEQ36899.1 hypothetical protein [Okeania sp. SIO3I5]